MKKNVFHSCYARSCMRKSILLKSGIPCPSSESFFFLQEHLTKDEFFLSFSSLLGKEEEKSFSSAVLSSKDKNGIERDTFNLNLTSSSNSPKMCRPQGGRKNVLSVLQGLFSGGVVLRCVPSLGGEEGGSFFSLAS